MSALPLWLSALGVTTLMQMTSAFLASAMVVVGPTITEAAGVTPEHIGDLSAIGAFGTMLFLAGGGPLLAHFGPVRLLQLGTLLAALALGLALTGWWPAMLAAALLVGVGYGPSPPAGSDILQRYSPRGRRSLIFSIKQSAVPLGGALVGLLVPPLAVIYGWRAGLATAAVIAAATTLLVQPFRALLDGTRERGPIAPLTAFVSLATLTMPFRAIALAPALPRLTFIGFTLATAQGCLLGFYVTYLVTDIGITLTAAGIAFAVMQATGVAGRIVIGWLTDRLGSAMRTLTWLAAGSTAAVLLIAATGEGWPWWALLGSAAVAGLAVTSWNGVYLAELAHVAPPGKIGEVTAGASLLTFVGYVLGPAAFATIVDSSGSYRIAFVLAALLPASAVIVLRRAKPPVPD
ncbi:MAG TPA: MFS transporter [Stellaceae bacterium]|nr:MFS transporter [Stellaceae bacterium]